MVRTVIRRQINAPVDRVFSTVADISRFSEAIPHITRVEFLSDSESGVGTRFRETRLMRGREATTELEVTEHVENERVRIVSDSHGTVWDSTFTVRQEGDRTELAFVMDARAYELLPRLLNPLMRRAVAKSIEADLDAVKTHCETAGTDSGQAEGDG